MKCNINKIIAYFLLAIFRVFIMTSLIVLSFKKWIGMIKVEINCKEKNLFLFHSICLFSLSLNTNMAITIRRLKILHLPDEATAKRNDLWTMLLYYSYYVCIHNNEIFFHVEIKVYFFIRIEDTQPFSVFILLFITYKMMKLLHFIIKTSVAFF